jgi:replicative DNA helicase
MSVGFGLISSLLYHQASLHEILDSGVTTEHFVEDEQRVFDCIMAHFQQFGVLPNMQTITLLVGKTPQKFPDEPVTYWVQQVLERKERRDLLQASEDIKKCLAADNLEAARGILRKSYINIKSSKESKKLIPAGMLFKKVIEIHDRRQRSAELSGISLGFPFLDEITDGAQPGDLIVISGNTGVGKSYLLLKMLLAACALNIRPMYVSLEMSALHCARRILALLSNVTESNIRLGSLSFWARNKILETIENFSEESPFDLFEGNLCAKVEHLGLKILELQPKIVYIDGAYLLQTDMRTSAKWEKVTATVEMLKMFSLEYKIPIVCTYQFNKKGPGISNIGLSSAIPQLASIVLSIDEMRNENTFPSRYGAEYKELTIFKGRSGERGKIAILYDMQRMNILQHMVPSEDISEGYL